MSEIVNHTALTDGILGAASQEPNPLVDPARIGELREQELGPVEYRVAAAGLLAEAHGMKAAAFGLFSEWSRDSNVNQMEQYTNAAKTAATGEAKLASYIFELVGPDSVGFEALPQDQLPALLGLSEAGAA